MPWCSCDIIRICKLIKHFLTLWNGGMKNNYCLWSKLLKSRSTKGYWVRSTKGYMSVSIWITSSLTFCSTACSNWWQRKHGTSVLLALYEVIPSVTGGFPSQKSINPLRAKFFRGNINIYLHFMSLLHIDMTQVFKLLPQVRPGLEYSTQSISWLLMSWRRKEPGHQQPWYWPSDTEITRSPHVNC